MLKSVPIVNFFGSSSNILQKPDDSSNPNQHLIYEFQQLLLKCWGGTGDPISPTAFKSALGHTQARFQNNEQVIQFIYNTTYIFYTLTDLLIGGGAFHFLEIFRGGELLIRTPLIAFSKVSEGGGPLLGPPLCRFRQKNL